MKRTIYFGLLTIVLTSGVVSGQSKDNGDKEAVSFENIGFDF